jgi:hypothetical protein
MPLIVAKDQSTNLVRRRYAVRDPSGLSSTLTAVGAGRWGAIPTAQGAWCGSLCVAPCLEGDVAHP